MSQAFQNGKSYYIYSVIGPGFVIDLNDQGNIVMCQENGETNQQWTAHNPSGDQWFFQNVKDKNVYFGPREPIPDAPLIAVPERDLWTYTQDKSLEAVIFHLVIDPGLTMQPRGRTIVQGTPVAITNFIAGTAGQYWTPKEI